MMLLMIEDDRDMLNFATGRTLKILRGVSGVGKVKCSVLGYRTLIIGLLSWRQNQTLLKMEVGLRS
jgi:hypothetical protein